MGRIFIYIFAEENVLEVILDLFFAGSETTSTTLGWGLLYMILNPAVQTKCRQEIFQVWTAYINLKNGEHWACVLFGRYHMRRRYSEPIHDMNRNGSIIIYLIKKIHMPKWVLSKQIISNSN